MLEEQNPTLKSQSKDSRRASFRHFVLQNQNNLQWLLTAAFLIGLGDWFTATHGHFAFQDNNISWLAFHLNLLTPALGLLIFRAKNSRRLTIAIAVAAFISIVFEAHFATLTCFVLLFHLWGPNIPAITILSLVILQCFSMMYMSSDGKPDDGDFEEWQYVGKKLILLSYIHSDSSGDAYSSFRIHGIEPALPGYLIMDRNNSNSPKLLVDLRKTEKLCLRYANWIQPEQKPD